MVVEARLGLGAGGAEFVFHGTEFQSEKMKKFWSWMVGSSYNNKEMYSMPQNCTLQND